MKRLLLCLCIVMLGISAIAQTYQLVPFIRCIQPTTSGKINNIQWIDRKDSLAVFGKIDSIHVYSDDGKSVILKMGGLHSSVKRTGATTWASAGDFTWGSKNSLQISFHTKINGVEYAVTNESPNFKYRNTSTNIYESVPLKYDGQIIACFDWGNGNILLIGNFFNINDKPYRQIALWNPNTNTLTTVGDGVLGPGVPGIVQQGGNSYDDTFVLIWFDPVPGSDDTYGYRVIEKGKTGWANTTSAFPKLPALSSYSNFEVISPTKIFFSGLDNNNSLAVYKLAGSSWQKVLTVTDTTVGVSPTIYGVRYKDGFIYVSGSFNKVSYGSTTKVCNYVFAYNEKVDTVSNIATNNPRALWMHMAGSELLFSGYDEAVELAFNSQTVFHLYATPPPTNPPPGPPPGPITAIEPLPAIGISATEVRGYPNPATSYVRITNVKELLKVINLHGQAISVGALRKQGNDIIVSLGACTAGMYYISVKSTKGVYVSIPIIHVD